jgi:DNA polymerase III delta' subunit
VIPFAGIRGQDQAVSFLRAALESNRVAHAYLIAGPPGTGKLSIALDLAAAWMCQSEALGYCGECSHCRRIRNFEHPDVRLTIPGTAATTPEQEMDLLIARRKDGTSPLSFEGNTTIRIQQVRELGRRMVLRPFEGHGRVEIVVDADKMMAQAANAILKTLEEPPDGTLIMLLTSIYTQILPTIRSRAHLIRLCRIPLETIAEVLSESGGSSQEEAHVIASAADGSIGRALLLRESGLEDKGLVPADLLSELAGCSSFSDVSGLASRLSKEHGRSGLLILCRETRMMVHDIRRRSAARTPLGFDPDTDALKDLDDLSLDYVVSAFAKCESRLTGNVMPSIALHAVLNGCWKVFRQEGARV